MREIKFRAWIDDEYMVFSDMSQTHPYNEDEIFWNMQGGLEISTLNIIDAIIGGEVEQYEAFEVRGGKGDKVFFMQFIGRQDSNYNDLYEGDVIYDHVGRGVIKWWETNNAFKVSYVDGNKGHGKWFADYTLKELESILKIGNIHENKELLCES
jgi:hypothetical protein